METILQSEFFKNYENLLWSSAILISTAIMLAIIKKLLVSKFKKRAELSSNKLLHIVSEIINAIKIPLLVIIGIYMAIITFEIHDGFLKILHTFFVGTLVLQFILVVQAVINIVIELNTQKVAKGSKDIGFLYKYLGGFLKGIVWIIGVLMFLSNIGYNVNSLIASLGIGGLAIALAVQNVLKDIFSSFMILINRPFQVGDFVQLNTNESGTISQIGIKNTIIKTIEGSELIVTNDDILNSRLYNFRSRKKRRVLLTLNLDLDTTKKKIEALKVEVLKILNKNELVDQEVLRVNVDSFTPQAIVINVVFFTINNEFDDFVTTKDEVNLKIKGAMEKLDIKLAKSVVTQ
jgi:small-conductance mechanosensitive channel